MKKAIFQFWFGDTMPDSNRQWCASMRRLAVHLGMEYRLESWADVRSRYTGNPVVRLFDAALAVAPNATTAALISDWYRFRMLADNGGGIYADCDYWCAKPFDWRPAGDLAMFNERVLGMRLATGLMWAATPRGVDAARAAVAAVEEKLLRTLGNPDADGWRAHYIDIIRTDKACDRGFSLVGYVGPRFVRNHLFSVFDAMGCKVESIPATVCANYRERNLAPVQGGAAIYHWGAGTWRLPDGWDELAARAAMDDAADASARAARQQAIASLPAHLRPQGRASLPKTQQAPVSYVPTSAVPSEVLGLFSIPRHTRRIVIFSNVTRGFPAFELHRGDLCVHLNLAEHFAEASTVPGVVHFLMERHGQNPKTKKRMWYVSKVRDFEGFQQVAFINCDMPFSKRPWFRNYSKENPKKLPTTGFIAANLFRDLCPGLPLYLVGFGPDKPHGRFRWAGHAWQYEATYYAANNFNLIPPTK